MFSAMAAMPSITVLAAAFIVLLVVPATAADVRFLREGVEMKTADVAAIMQVCAPTTIDVDDPNAGARRRYRGCRLADVLAFGFGEPPAALGSADVFIRAWDGYDAVTSAERLAEDGAWIAFGDADRPAGFAPLGAKAIDPGPLYLVWTKPSQRDPKAYPWPWQIAEFEIVEFRKKY